MAIRQAKIGDEPYTFIARLPQELRERVQEFAKRENASLNSVVVDAITKYLNTHSA